MDVTEHRHGDPLDYPDIPADTEFSDAYREATTPPHVKEAIAKRKAERATAELPAKDATR